MRRTTISLVMILVLAVVARAETPAELIKRVGKSPAAMKDKIALAEAYLQECRLDESLAAWRAVLKADPKHQRGRQVVGRLTRQRLNLDSHLDVLQTMIDRGIGGGEMAKLLTAAGRRAARNDQKARILYLRGRSALGEAVVKPGKASTPAPAAAEAVSLFQTARKLYPATPWAGRSVIELARVYAKRRDAGEARRLLAGVIEDRQADKTVVEQARLALVVLAGQGLSPQDRIAAIRSELKRIKAPSVRREALAAIVGQIRVSQGRWVAEAVAAVGEILKADPPTHTEAHWAGLLLEVARDSQDRSTLDAVGKVCGQVKLKDRAAARELAFAAAQATLGRAVIEDDVAAMGRLLTQAQRGIDALGRDGGLWADRQRVREIRGRRLMVEAQKLLALRGATAALPVLLKAREHYLSILASDPAGALGRLGKIAQLLEHAEEWETAAALHREVATQLPHRREGRDSLLKVARIYENHLDAPQMAIDVYAEYAARYPAELAYRQMTVGKRLERLGYVNVQDFQKRNRLKVDGLFGPTTARKLSEIESAFDAIRRRGAPGEDSRRGSDVLRGQFVHPLIYRLAHRLETAGRHDEAIRAYRTFLNLFPTKAQADDALLTIARLFRDNLLFAEALGAYEQLMEDYPKGDKTSEAYIESAVCLENLGRWKSAREMYELYLRKFPKYPHVKLCKSRLALLAEIQQYQDFVADNPRNPKVAEAQYQIATLLYKQLKNHTKAAVEFVKVADRHPKHARAPEGLFTAGSAQLRAENFPAGRAVFERLVKGYPDSRLADDGQYWIAHTWEYSARALGLLDRRNVVLKRRSLRSRSRLLADMELRRRYYPKAAAGAEMPQDVWGGDTLGVLTSGSKRDRVNADLYRAIRAYRKVVDQFKMGDMAGHALLRIGAIYTQYLKDPEQGIKAYQELLAHYPASKEAAGALYEVGSYHRKKKAHDAAIEAYRKFIYNYPRAPKVEDAMLAIAACYVVKKDWNKALDAYQQYLSKYPKGKHAVRAKGQVEWIRMYHF